MLQPVATAQTGIHLTIPASLTRQAPLYGFGQFVPLHRELQVTRGVTYYGPIVGLELIRWDDGTHDWSYTIEIPTENPKAEFYDWQTIYTEDEVSLLLERM